MHTDEIRLIQADARNLPLADESVQCIVTSPPYWGLRKYAGEQESVWGGYPKIDPGSLKPKACDHVWTATATATEKTGGVTELTAATCQKCAAWRGAYGLEPTIEMYVAHTVTILREMRRVLRRDGVLLWNIGDSYFASGIRKNNFETFNPTYGTMGPMDSDKRRDANVEREMFGSGLKPKDLCLIPARIALAAQSDGWWVRSLIVWAKPNPMPESVTDRPTDAYEHIIMLTKSERYYWDADAVREPAVAGWRGSSFTDERDAAVYPNLGQGAPGTGNGGRKAQDRGSYEGWAESRNLRNVWMFPTQPYSGGHFATFPEELPRRCILAATSAKGACAQCGAPWERVTRVGATSGKSWNSDMLKSQGVNRNENSDFAGVNFYQNYSAPQTIGWTPICRCRGQHGRTQPCVVLDPFGGSGTTGRVAVSLRRRAVLCDVAYGEQDEYRRLAETRTRNVQVEFPQ